MPTMGQVSGCAAEGYLAEGYLAKGYAAKGYAAKGYEVVRDAFSEVLAGHSGTGAAASFWRDGRWVVDLWGGWADTDRTRPWARDSIVQPYSVSKPFAAICALILHDRGRLDLDEQVATYWPEFATRTTVRELLSHQSGIVALDDPLPTEAIYDWDRICSLLARQPPCWPPGTAHGESALFYGHLVGEIVRRVDGRSLGQFLSDEVCGPLGLDFHFGLTAEQQSRAVELTGFDEMRAQQQHVVPPELYARAIGNPPGARDPRVVNGPSWRAAQIPAVNGHGTARGIAGFYAALMQGKILSASALSQATAAQCSGIDLVFGEENSWGLGFAVDADGYGMAGLGGSWAGVSTAGRYALAFVTGQVGDHDRATLVENAFRGCIGLGPLE